MIGKMKKYEEKIFQLKKGDEKKKLTNGQFFF